jgi:2'-5' RNA ligase
MSAISGPPALANGAGGFPESLWRIKSICPQCGGPTRSDGTATWCSGGCEWNERRPELPASYKDLAWLDKGLHKFSSTQFDLEKAGYNRTQGPPIPKIRELQEQIADEDLAEDGKEERYHVTVKYGLHTSDPEDVKRAVQKWLQGRRSPSVGAKLGAVTLFPAKEGEAQRGGDVYDVVKLDVDSPDLASLNRALSDGLEHTDTHPDYHPHVTLAYVKPGLGRKYIGQGLGGHEVLLYELVFSDTDKHETVIDLWELGGGSKRIPDATEGTPGLEAVEQEGKTLSAYNQGLGGALVGAGHCYRSLLKKRPPKSLFFDPEGIKFLRNKHGRKGMVSSALSAVHWLKDKWAELEPTYGRQVALGMAVARGLQLNLLEPGGFATVVAAAAAARGISYALTGLKDIGTPFSGFGRPASPTAAPWTASPFRRVKSQGQPCKQGETAEQTECVPASGNTVGQRKKTPTNKLVKGTDQVPNRKAIDAAKDAMLINNEEDAGFLYHYTYKGNLENIATQGLLPQGKVDPGVSATRLATPTIADTLFADAGTDDLVLLRFKEGGKWRTDVEFYNEYFVKSDDGIAPTDIEIKTEFGWEPLTEERRDSSAQVNDMAKLGAPTARPLKDEAAKASKAEVHKVLQAARGVVGRYNHGTLAGLRRALPWPREQADRAIARAWYEGLLTLPVSEGRSVGGKAPLSPEEEQAAFRDDREGEYERTYAHVQLTPDGERAADKPVEVPPSQFRKHYPLTENKDPA